MNRNPKEKTEAILIRLSPQEKKRIEQFSKKCGLSQSEYVRKRALGYEPNTALPDAFFAVYQKLCDVANQAEINGFAETVKQLNDLIEYTHTRLIKPSQKTTKEIEEEMDEWLRQDFGL
jgi:hypothetical protein